MRSIIRPSSAEMGSLFSEGLRFWTQLVREQGPNNWVRISQHMHYRSPKQCRERFHQEMGSLFSEGLRFW
jgi:Myb-like DNA-binding protein FlbD